MAEIPADWGPIEYAAVVTCPDCAFSFAADHIDNNGGYSCPVCAETRLQALVDNFEPVTIGIGSPMGDLFIVETGEEYDEHETDLYILRADDGG